eukprot:jgi/Mesvir1/21675/Mv04096-RA.1
MVIISRKASLNSRRRLRIRSFATFSEDEGAAEPTEMELTIQVCRSIHDIPAKDWDECALAAAGGDGKSNPFITHAFLSALEDSGSAVPNAGWVPVHLMVKDKQGKIQGVMPLYLKNHSQGEYVFDHTWANAFHRYGLDYYPKLQCCVPFTPATGPRLLVRPTKGTPMADAVLRALASALAQVNDQFKVSSSHITFPTHEEWQALGEVGYLQRTGVQYHWLNEGYQTFEDFLAALKQKRRKSIRQERKQVAAAGVTIMQLTGEDIKPRHWDAFYRFYINTTTSHWGQAYLTRKFFTLLSERMGDKVLLVMAEHEGELVAGAFNLIGGDTLFGRNWGCTTHFKHLHFEVCYYQAIEAAIKRGMRKVEAGAQGEHKIQRGYLPTVTYSAHYIRQPELRRSIADFLSFERTKVDGLLELYDAEANPFKAPA